MFSLILAQATGEGGVPFQFLFLIGIFVVFYFFMIRPQQKKQKEQKKWIAEISKGDEVVTVGGIHGKVMSVDDDTVLLEVDRGVKLTVNKGSLSLDATTPEKK